MIKRAVKTGRITIGGGSPVSVQSMTNTDTADTEATTAQLKALEKAGCDIARLAVRDFKDVEACRRYIENFDMPLVADIQFDYRLAVACADIGFSKVRFNPGNTSAAGVRELAAACKANGCPIRIGINGGSLEKDIKAKYGGVTAHGLAESAIRTVRSLERESFSDIVISVKASDVRLTVDAYTELDKLCGYPLHIGITESGAGTDAIIKSAAGIGGLLLAGIGDTIRVSLTGDPVREVITGKSILRAVGLDKNYVEVVSCPTCARCFYDLEGLVGKCKAITDGVNKPLKIAVMGCVVNGPGEAADADVGIAGGRDKAVLFRKGKVIRTLPVAEAEEEFMRMVGELVRG